MKKVLFIIIAVIAITSCEKATPKTDNENKSVTKTEVLSHTYNLDEGWNSISFYLEGESDNIADILEPIYEYVVQCKSLTGIYAPGVLNNGEDLNTIGNIDYSDGFIINVSEACSFTHYGTPTTAQVVLTQGYNRKGVPFVDPIPVEQLFPIDSAPLNIVKDAINGQQLYYPALGINYIGNAQPGKAYYIYVE